VQMTGKFDLVITSHLFEDLTDPMVPRSSNPNCNLMTSGEMLLTIDDLWIPTLKKTGFSFSPFSLVVLSENLCRSSLLFFGHWNIDLG